VTPWLLLDYGEVISRSYDAASLREISDILALDEPALTERYWAHRKEFDAGRAAADYWADVAGRPVAADDLARIAEADLRGWARLDPTMVTLIDEQAAAGVRLALLSNAPHWQADAFDHLAWTDRFEHVFVSSRLGLVKPDPAIFEHVLATLDAEPDEVTFVDDRTENVEAAARAGLRALHFTGVDKLREQLR
jgi:putative hydrolase of the HAD superfamily